MIDFQFNFEMAIISIVYMNKREFLFVIVTCNIFIQ